ncbi:MAG: glycoside hydrolase family 97 protein [Candidatus Aminicenantes bacterium]|nr:glycoside hydrolase family 97 protein [Candidatus Aminicenantes bacterium]
MFKIRRLLGVSCLCVLIPVFGSGRDYTVQSPDRTVELRVGVTERITYSVLYKNRGIIFPSPLSLTLRDQGKLGENPEVMETHTDSVNEVLTPVVREKNAHIPDVFNRLRLRFLGGYEVVFRVYNDGVAYRFITSFDQEIEVMSEEAVFHFPEEASVYFAEDTGFFTHQEKPFLYLPLSEIGEDRIGYPPAVVEIKDGPKVLLTEAGLFDYAGLYLRGTGGSALRADFPAVAVKEEQTRDRDVKVVERSDYLARTGGTRSFPWRVLLIAGTDGELITSQLVYKLSPPLRLEKTDWIRPGKVAWDWWNALNLFGVDFEAGLNTETYKHYIDFAADYGLEYVILDEGWYVLGNLLDIKPEIDIPELVSYGRSKNVGIILWVVWKTLEDQLEEALDQFEQWGIRGIKVDFMQRDDQWMVNYYWKIAEKAAKRKLLVDFHGAYKPTGLRRAFPNVLTREGVLGLEHNKWSVNANPDHNCTLPFIRMVAGPMDYTPGAMINAQKNDFKAIFSRPMSMGTRCHQMARYVVYESPLQMLADSPSHYTREPECTSFISKVPVEWDETRVLAAKIGDFVAVARRSGDMWYVGALTDWTPRELDLDLSFLSEGTFTADVFQDGVNAHRYGNDYRTKRLEVTSSARLKIRLAPGGGFTARIGKISRPDPKN